MKRLLPFLAVVASATPLLAQNAAAGGPDLPQSTSVLDVMLHSGPIIYPLLAMSVFSVMLVIVT